MYNIEKVIRNNNGKEKIMTIFFGVGRLTADVPEPIVFQSGAKKISKYNFSLACPKNKEDTEFFRLEAWDKQADILVRFGYKGQKVAVIGRYEERSWEDDKGNKNNYKVVVVEKIEFLEFRKSQPDGTQETQGIKESLENDEDFVAAEEEIIAEINDELPF